MNFAAVSERISRLEDERVFQNLAKSKKRTGPAHDDEVAAGLARQQVIRELVKALQEETDGAVYDDREMFISALNDAVKAHRRPGELDGVGMIEASAIYLRDAMRVSERGQITIPKRLREQFGMHHDVEVEITPTDDGLLIRKCAADPIDSVSGAVAPAHFATLGVADVDEYIEAIRGR